MSSELQLKNSGGSTLAITHSDSKGGKTIIGTDIVTSVATINDFPSVGIQDGDTVIVKDANRGGTFIYRSADVATNNGGTIFNGWCRQHEGSVNVKWFGAKGDNSTDDIMSIMDAVRYLDSIGGGELYYPAGFYLVSRAIRLDAFDYRTDAYVNSPLSKITHSGAGAEVTTVKSTSYNSIFSAFPEPYLTSIDVPDTVLGTDIIIEGITLDCDYMNVPDYGTSVYSDNTYKFDVSKLGGTWANGSSSPSIATWASDNYQYPVYAYYNERITIRECLIKNSWYNGIEIYRTSTVDIMDNKILNCGNIENVFGLYAGMQFDNRSQSIRATNNVVDNCGNGFVSNGDAKSYATNAVRDVFISNNLVTNISGNGIYAFDWIHNWKVENNIFRGIGGSPINFFFQGVGAEPDRFPDKISICNNLIEDFNIGNTDRNAITFNGISSIISGNMIYDRRSATTANTRAILVSDGNITTGTYESISSIVEGNIILGRFPTDSNSGAIQLSADNTTVVGNKISIIDTVCYTGVKVLSDGSNILNNDIYGTFSSSRDAEVSSSTEYFVDLGSSNQFFAGTTTSNIAATGWTTIPLNSIEFDNYSVYSSSTNKISAIYNGYYELSVNARFEGLGSTGTEEKVILVTEKNGTTFLSQVADNSEGGDVSLSSSVVVKLERNNTIALKVYTSDVTGITIRDGLRFTARYISNYK